MRAIVRRSAGMVVIVHGLIHLLGVAKGFGWAEVSQLTQPIGTTMGVVWLLATVLVVAAGALLTVAARWWWAVAAVAAVVSQVAILTSWSDAKAGTLANVVLSVAAVYGFAAYGPMSYRARFRRLARETTAVVACVRESSGPPLTDLDLADLPAPVADYVRATGAVGRPHVRGFHADISGRIRSGADKAWMHWVGEQVNTFGTEPSRVFLIDATMSGVPADVLHVYHGQAATMQVKVASLVRIIDARGPKMDLAETVTLLNDLCVLAPAALVDAAIDWTPIDDHHARATYTNAHHTVSAVLTFNDDHELVDFVSDDRLRSSVDGRVFTPQRWSTPIGGYRAFDGRRIGALGRGCWHPDGEPSFDYLEFYLDDISYLEDVGGRLAEAGLDVVGIESTPGRR